MTIKRELKTNLEVIKGKLELMGIRYIQYGNLLVWKNFNGYLSYITAFNSNASQPIYTVIGSISITNINTIASSLKLQKSLFESKDRFIEAKYIDENKSGINKEIKSLILTKNGIDIMRDKRITTASDFSMLDNYCLVNCTKYGGKAYLIDADGNLVKFNMSNARILYEKDITSDKYAVIVCGNYGADKRYQVSGVNRNRIQLIER